MNNEIRNESQALPESIRCVGADDLTLSLFENQYPVQPMGVSYNSYLILDEKIAVMDSVDARAADEWLAKLAHELNGRSPDYLVISHMEPDHSGSILRLAEKYQEMKLVGNTKTFTMLRQFFGAKAPTDDRLLEVGEGETLPLGAHTLHFMLAPMVHWPEVMVAYEETEKLLFSADAFGRFGSLGRTAKRAVGAAGTALLLQHRRQVRRAGTGTAEKGVRAGDQNGLPAPRARADGRSTRRGPAPLRPVVALAERVAG